MSRTLACVLLYVKYILNRLSVVRMFMKRRTEQLAAVKRLLAIDSYEKQYKMVSVIAEKVFSVRSYWNMYFKKQNGKKHLAFS